MNVGPTHIYEYFLQTHTCLSIHSYIDIFLQTHTYLSKSVGLSDPSIHIYVRIRPNNKS
jgi:hypothetical protein